MIAHFWIRVSRSRGRASAALMVIAILAGCDITHVASPNVVTPSQFQNDTGALTLRAGAIAAFAQAYSDQIVMAGLLSDELTDLTGSFKADQRIIATNGSLGSNYPYDELSGARINALLAIHALELYSPSSRPQIAELFAYLGNVEVFFAENMCSGVPLGVLVAGNPSYGKTLSRQQLLQRALADLDSASHFSAANDSIANLARIARARALLDSNLDLASRAAQVADSVGEGFAYSTSYGNIPNQQNTVFGALNLRGVASLSDREGINGLDFISANDPRVPRDSLGPGRFGILSDSSVSAPIKLASWIEARLIRAEADLHAGNASAWLADLNALRGDSATTGVPGLMPLADPGSSNARIDLMFRERAFWLFGSGHRQGDLRRLVRQYKRQTESVFPTGQYRNGPQRYGTDVVFVPFGESNNPNFAGCFDRLP